MTRSPTRPEEDDPIGGLATHDVRPARAAEIRRQAHLLLRERRHAQQPSRTGRWLHGYHRFVEPAVLIGLGLWQLAWTVQDTVALFH